MVLAGVRVPLGVKNGVEREGRVPLHDVGELEAGQEQRVGEGSPALGAVARAVVLLPAPVLRDALAAEVVLASKTYRVLVNAQADGTQELVLQTTRHLHARGDVRKCDTRRENREPGDPETSGFTDSPDFVLFFVLSLNEIPQCSSGFILQFIIDK